MTALRLLVLSPYAPSVQAHHGGARVVAETTRRMAEEADVALAYLHAREEPPADPDLLERCRHVVEAVRPSQWGGAGDRTQLRRLFAAASGRPSWVAECETAELHDRLRDLQREWKPDVAHVHYQVMGQYLRSLDPGARTVLVAPEPATMRAAAAAREAGGARRLLRSADSLAWRRFERRLLTAVDATVVFTARDREELRRLAPGGAPISVIPIGVSIPERPSSPLGSDDLVLFVGNFGHGPNVDAALRLTDEILPLLLRARPHARLELVGPQPPPELRDRAGSSVAVPGEVPELAPYLDRAAVVVTPVRLGGGMRLKVVEALAAGKAVVASPLAAEGLAVTDGKELRLADTAEQFAAVTADLLSNADRRRELGERARRFAVENLSWEERVSEYRTLHDSLLGRDAGPAASTAAAEGQHHGVAGETTKTGASPSTASVPSPDDRAGERG